MPFHRELFLDAVRASFGPLSRSQAQGLGAILDRWAARGDDNLPHFAYMLATAWHETGRTMRPVEENLTYTTAERIHAVWPTVFPTVASAASFVRQPHALANKVYGGRNGNVGVDDGWTFRGRGYVQLTGRGNYARAARALGVDLTEYPYLALDPPIAANVLFSGMAEGWFTGRKLSDYDRMGGQFDAVNARRVVGGLDQAGSIAACYDLFLRTLLAARRVPAPVTPAPVADAAPIAKPPPPDAEPGPVAGPDRGAAVTSAPPPAADSLLARLFAAFGRRIA